MKAVDEVENECNEDDDKNEFKGFHEGLPFGVDMIIKH